MGMDSIKRTIKEAPTRLTELQVRVFPSLSPFSISNLYHTILPSSYPFPAVSP